MRLLLMTGPLLPRLGNNANLLGKLIPQFLADGHEVQLFSTAFEAIDADLPSELLQVPVNWVTDQRQDWKRTYLYPTIARVIDPNGFSDALQVKLIVRELKHICREHPFDVLLSTSEPYSMAVAAAKLTGIKKVLYMMDPPACISSGVETKYRNHVLPTILKNQNAIVTTPFIREALAAHGFVLPDQTVSAGFPMIAPGLTKGSDPSDDRIHLLYSGWLYSNIRSPKYFLDILSRLDDRFVVTFMGRECEKLTERFDVHTKAELITVSQQPYEVALQAMANADIMINIGNSVPVHMPSKTLEYINTGKPFVNFYKMDDCPTLYYTKRYPLCLNMSEKDTDFDAAARRFIEFCIENKAKTVDRAYIESEYADCTPEYIARRICSIATT